MVEIVLCDLSNILNATRKFLVLLRWFTAMVTYTWQASNTTVLVPSKHRWKCPLQFVVVYLLVAYLEPEVKPAEKLFKKPVSHKPSIIQDNLIVS